jgi:hypothetical protein
MNQPWLAEVSESLRAEEQRVRDFMAEHLELLERDEAALQRELQRAEALPADVPGAVNDVQRRYEMAMDDIRELKSQNEELRRQLAQARAQQPAGGVKPGGAMDWEAEKNRILAALEADMPNMNAARKAERVRIEDVLRATGNVVAEKDQEIAELRQRLENARLEASEAVQRRSLIDKAIDADAAIAQERERLRQLQEHWRDELRKAEIELSVERAKIARQRAEMEEKIRALESAPPKPQAEESADSPARGRWLARLGLTEADRDPTRPR